MSKNFQLWPAIDILDAKPVRLLQGDYDKKTEFDIDFKKLAEVFSTFADGIHVVDLDGAKEGRIRNLKAIEEIVKFSKIPVEIGGGIRSMKDAEMLFKRGVSRVIIGTNAIKNPYFADDLVKEYGSRKVAISVDARDGFIATDGWVKTSKIRAEDFIAQLCCVKNVIFTDISSDGMLQGPPLAKFNHLVNKFPDLDFIASGGVGSIDDLYDLKNTGVKGAVFGRAFYEGKIELEDLKRIG